MIYEDLFGVHLYLNSRNDVSRDAVLDAHMYEGSIYILYLTTIILKNNPIVYIPMIIVIYRLRSEDIHRP